MSESADPTKPADTPAPGPFSRRSWEILRHGPLGRYMAGEAISMTGTWMQTFAQGWVMAGLTNKAVMLGMVNFVGALPMLALSMYAGTVADKYDKRKILVVTNVVQVVLALLLGWLVMTHRVQIWHVLTAALLLGFANAFEMPSASALVPELVDREHIVTAIAVDRSIFHGTRLLGPSLAGFAAAWLGTASAFYANAASFLAMIIALFTIAPRQIGTVEEEEQRSTGGMKAGWNYVKKDRPTMAMLGLMASNSLCIFPFMAVMMPLYAKNTLGLDVRYTSWLMSVSGVGALVASMGVLSVPRPRRLPSMFVGMGVIVVSLLGLSAARSFWQAAVALVALAVGTSFNFALANTTVQERAPGPIRGRVSALAMLSFVGIMPFSSLIVTELADFTSIRLAMAVCAVIYGVVSFVLFAGPGRHAGDLPLAPTAAVPVEA